MVERLKDAINKARQQREGQIPPPAAPSSAEPAAAPSPQQAPSELRDAMLAAVAKSPQAARQGARVPMVDEWAPLEALKLDAELLEKNRIIAHRKSNPGHLPFDMLRTRLLNVLRTNNWTRLAITSPTKGCGKSMVSANLALSLGHQPDLKSMFFDVDMRMPAQAKNFGIKERFSMAEFLQGQIEPSAFLRRVGTNLAIGFNTIPERAPAELFHHERTKKVLSAALTRFRPNVVIYDLPPLLVSDDVMAFLPHVDCVLMVASAGVTTPKEISAAEQLLEDQTNFLGVMLNKSKEKSAQGYHYYS